jgi:hypothetical protein
VSQSGDSRREFLARPEAWRPIASHTPIVKPAIDAGQIAVVAAVYDIKTGKISLI